MKGIILYNKEDIKKNTFFVEKCKSEFQKNNIEIELLMVDDGVENDLDKIRPEFAINRSRNFELSSFLEKKGIKVFNTSKITEVGNNKYKTYKKLKDVVDFLPIEYKGEIITSGIEKDIAYPVVIKSIAGHGGNEVFLAKNKDDKNKYIKMLGKGNCIIQSFCNEPGKDVRVYVVGGEIICSMLRTNEKDFKSNYSLGGKSKEYYLSEEEKNIVNKILEILPLDYGGVDFIFHNKRMIFNEIEDAVGARMVYENTDMDIIKIFVEYVSKEMKNRILLLEK